MFLNIIIVYFRPYVIVLVYVNFRPDIKWTKNGEPITAGERHKFVYPDQETAALIISKGIGTYHEMSRNLCIKLFHFFSHRR